MTNSRLRKMEGRGCAPTTSGLPSCKLVGCLDIDPAQCHPNYIADIREGAAIEQASCELSVNLKERFPEEYGADDDSFEGAETEQA